MALFYSLCSSSKGNSTFIGSNDSGILIDAGIGIRNFESLLLMAGISSNAIKAIFITHEHSDHIQGLRKITDKYPHLPVFGSSGTLNEIIEKDAVNAKCKLYEINKKSHVIDGIKVSAFHTSHDSKESLAYKVFTPDYKSIAVCTDLGFISDNVSSNLSGCDFVLLESNYDIEMLHKGSYPHFLKSRIAGEQGHLSNDDCANEIIRLVKSGTQHFALGHLSQENNRPDTALEHSLTKLSQNQMRIDEDFTLSVLPIRNSGRIIEI